MQPAWENLDVFLQTDTAGGFAVTATVRYADGRQKALIGIFDEPYLDAELGEYRMDDAQPRFLCKSADVVDVKRGDVLMIDRRQFFVMSYPQQDGTGMSILALEWRND